MFSSSFYLRLIGEETRNYKPIKWTMTVFSWTIPWNRTKAAFTKIFLGKFGTN
jgi:hypothetical protein